MYKVFFVLTVFVVVVYSRPEDQYTTKYDGINIDEILGNKRLLDGYCNCLTGEGKCSPDGKELKDVLPDALQTGCSKCNEKQKAGAEKIIRHLVEHEKDCFQKLEDAYDKEGVYRKKYEADLKERNIKL